MNFTMVHVIANVRHRSKFISKRCSGFLISSFTCLGLSVNTSRIALNHCRPACQMLCRLIASRNTSSIRRLRFPLSNFWNAQVHIDHTSVKELNDVLSSSSMGCTYTHPPTTSPLCCGHVQIAIKSKIDLDRALVVAFLAARRALINTTSFRPHLPCSRVVFAVEIVQVAGIPW